MNTLECTLRRVNRSLPTLLLLTAIGFCAVHSTFAGDRTTHWPPASYRIHPSDAAQFEVSIAVDPTNLSILLVSCSTYKAGFMSEGVYVTTNGGQGWSGNDTCNGQPLGFHNGEPGITIDKDGTFILIRWGVERELASHYSTNRGVYWSQQLTMTVENQERSHLASDANPSSQYFGRTYAAWVRALQPYAVHFAYTIDGARTWSAPVQVNSPTSRGSGARIALDATGTIFVCWASVISTSPFTEDYVGLASSTNGGGAWTMQPNAFDMNGIAGLLPDKGNIKVKGLPKMDIDRTTGPRRGWIYIVTAQKNLSPSGADPDIVLNRSTDGGGTWSGRIRVNQDALNNGKTQFFPSVHVDGSGAVNVVYYDDRNTTYDSSGVFLSRSTDGGNTWRDYQIGDHNYRPGAIAGFGQGYVGDNIGLIATGNTLWPVWMDNSTGIYQLWTAPIDLTTLSTREKEQTSPRRFGLSQNFPNPFNPSCQIEYELPSAGFVTLTVYDVFGRELSTLVREKQSAGTHRAVFDAHRLSIASGVYFYRLTVGERFWTRKMLLLK